MSALTSLSDQLWFIQQMFCVLKRENTSLKVPQVRGQTKERRGREVFVLETAAYCGLLASAEQLFRIFSSLELSLVQ